jgi:putative transposase
MIISKTYKIEFRYNKVQETLLYQSCGVARFAYNWGLERKINSYKENKTSPSSIDLHKELILLKRIEEYSWLNEVSKCAPQEALRDLDKAFVNFFRDNKGFPKFKSKHKSVNSFRINSKPLFKIIESRLYLNIPKIGLVRLLENDYLQIDKVKFNSYTIIKDGLKWFVCFNVEENIEDPKKLSKAIVGVDLGIKTLATCSNGKVYENPKNLKKHSKKLKRIQRQLARRKVGSKNRYKTKNKLVKLHYKIRCSRKDTLHKMTTELVRTKPITLIIEDLKVKSMLMKDVNSSLKDFISDASFYEIRRQLEYKSKWYGGNIVVADQFFPSSKLCSKCNNKKDDLKLSDRTYICSECGLTIDRDLNASINLKNYKSTVSSTERYVYGDPKDHGNRKKTQK